MALFADEIAAFPLATTVFPASSITVVEPLVHSILRFSPTEFLLASPLSVRPSKCMSMATLDWAGSLLAACPPGEATVPATDPSTIAPVAERFGSRTNPDVAPSALSEAEGCGKFPKTEATFVEGETPTTCIHEVVRFRPLALTDCESIAHTESDFASYAAKTSSKTFRIPVTLNFSGLSFNRTQLGFPAV